MSGIWDRLRQYSESLPGATFASSRWCVEEGADGVALLEFWSMRTEDQHLLDREGHWKRVLMSREHGLNLN